MVGCYIVSCKDLILFKNYCSDVDPDPVGSAFILSQRYKMKGKAELNQQIIFFKSESKKVPISLVNYIYFLIVQDLNLDRDPQFSNFVEPDPHTINSDPHH